MESLQSRLYIAIIERVQKRATKMLSSCKKMRYIDRLKYLHLPTMKFRRLRGDMIETYKILNGFYDTDVVPSLPRNYDSRTRGNSLKLLHMRPKYDLKLVYTIKDFIKLFDRVLHEVLDKTSYRVDAKIGVKLFDRVLHQII